MTKLTEEQQHTQEANDPLDTSENSPKTQLVEYYKNHMSDHNAIDANCAFIEKNMNLANGKIEVKGWLILPYIGMVINFISSVIILQAILSGSVPLANLVYVLPPIVIIAIFYNSNKRRKSTILLFKLYFALLIFLGLLTQNPSATASVLWLVYMFKSNRVKYTFIF